MLLSKLSLINLWTISPVLLFLFLFYFSFSTDFMLKIKGLHIKNIAFYDINASPIFSYDETLEKGDVVCPFPKGMSRCHPSVALLKTESSLLFEFLFYVDTL